MKISVNELKSMVGQIVSEAKKKKSKSEKPMKGVKPTGFSFDEAFDFSTPLGDWNLYARQGSSSWGPLTGPGTKLGEELSSAGRSLSENAVRSLVRQVIKEHAAPMNIWESAMHWYDNQKLGLGSQTSEGIQQKKLDNAKKLKKKGSK